MPATEDGVVYVGVAAFEIVALRASDGTVLWRRPDPLVPYDVTRNVVIDHGILVAIGQYRLIRMRASDGTVLSQVARGSANYGYLPRPALDQGVLYAGDREGLYALRVADGQMLWQVPPPPGQVSLGSLSGEYPPFSQPLVADGVVYIGTLNGPVAALRASDGELLWRSFVVPPSPQMETGLQPLPQQPLPLAIAAGNLYVGGDSNEPGLLLVSARDGRLERPLPGFSQQFFNAGVTDGGVLYITAAGSAGGTTTAVRLVDATLLWQVHVGDGSNDTVGADRGIVFVNGSLVAARESDGAVLWRYPGPNSFTEVASGSIYLSQSGVIDFCSPRQSRPAAIVSLSETDGSVLWSRTETPSTEKP